jgi:hypothetical protein
VYIETENQILYVDETRQYYFTTIREKLSKCKSAEAGVYICKQTQPLLNSHMQESCMVKLFQPRVTIQQICDTRIVHISHSIWTRLEKRNEWIYFIPSSDSVTIACPNKEPVEVVLRYTGKLKIQSGCKGYNKTALLSTESEIRVNTSRNGGDLLSKVDSEFECCESLGISINLSHVDLDMKFKHVVTHVEDLKYASFKISELEKLTREQEWKNKHTQHHKTYSILVYIALSILMTYGLYKLGKFVAHRCRTN